MSLRRKMVLQIGATIVGLLLTIGTSLWGLNGLRQDYALALHGYAELRELFEVGSHLAAANTLITSIPPARAAARVQVERGMARFSLGPAADGIPGLDDAWITDSGSERADIQRSLNDAVTQLRSAPEENLDPDLLGADGQAIGSALGRVGTLAAGIRQKIEQSQHAAQAKRRETVIAMAVVSGIAVLWAIVLGISQYRGVLTPLRSLGESVRRLAGAEFTGRVDESGAEEFAALAREFNRMATELHGFYTQLEQRVAQKSRELVRSERLASVGFLAAGVAHEINNPLGIISGYAEYMLTRMKSAPSQVGAVPPISDGVIAEKSVDDELRGALQTICEEAFRCKDITGKLLSLARGGDDERKPVDLGEVSTQVGAMVGALHDYRDRKVRVEIARPSDLRVLGDEAEMKQVVLNLTINALEATARGTGQVMIRVERRGEMVELAVADNGRGMSAQTLERVFEPFFTDKLGARQAGTGLGLSITHAIIESHAGRIRAESDGSGKGSRFVVELPVYGVSAEAKVSDVSDRRAMTASASEGAA